jgi:transcriptional regulator with XRE-family HTH domain
MSEQEWLDIFASNLDAMIRDKGMTQLDLADDTGLSKSTISSYINARKMPGVKAIVNIAYALDCDVSDLIDFGETIE